ncbi:hypothetical protein [Peribacillus asahii]|uniref:hypothetical protein n=1 Tax=Peribacillus asahii TaxID=228899 RepID=UPI00207A5FBC|nr:hypothetical protein [Peribacillus asahii]USK71783.1 hypothetical protein LIS76_08520 [Peribacillus asahii]
MKTIISDLILTKDGNEGLFDFEECDDFFSVKYYKKLLSAELVFDNKNERIHTESLQKVLISYLHINKKKNSGMISGNLTACQLFEEFLSINSPLTLRSRAISFESMLAQFNSFNYSIYKLSFSNVKFLNTSLPTITLEFNNNHDALNIIKKINSKPCKVSLQMNFEDDTAKLTTNLKSGSITITTDSIKNIHLELLKEKLLNLIEENENV